MARAEDGSTAGDGELRPWEQSDLEQLRFSWGAAYEIGPWKARRRDGLGGWIDTPGPEELRAAIIADYTARKVPR